MKVETKIQPKDAIFAIIFVAIMILFPACKGKEYGGIIVIKEIKYIAGETHFLTGKKYKFRLKSLEGNYYFTDEVYKAGDTIKF